MNDDSFEMRNSIDYEPGNEIKIAYLKKDGIPEITIFDKNRMIYDGIECQIS